MTRVSLQLQYGFSIGIAAVSHDSPGALVLTRSISACKSAALQEDSGRGSDALPIQYARPPHARKDRRTDVHCAQAQCRQDSASPLSLGVPDNHPRRLSAGALAHQQHYKTHHPAVSAAINHEVRQRSMHSQKLTRPCTQRRSARAGETAAPQGAAGFLALKQCDSAPHSIAMADSPLPSPSRTCAVVTGRVRPDRRIVRVIYDVNDWAMRAPAVFSIRGELTDQKASRVDSSTSRNGRLSCSKTVPSSPKHRQAGSAVGEQRRQSRGGRTPITLRLIVVYFKVQ